MGNIPGNKGRPHSEKTKRKMSNILKGRHSSPETEFKKGHLPTFGMKGKHHSRNARKKIAEQILEQIKNGKTLLGYGKAGKREDLNDTFFRSRWEANYARYLNFLKIKWEFEPKTFWFKKIKRGTLSYTPDFYLPVENKFIEIKGWFDDKSKTKLKRFKKYYPQYFEKLIIIIKDPWSESKSSIEAMKFLDKLEIPPARVESYREIEDKLGGLIPNWE